MSQGILYSSFLLFPFYNWKLYFSNLPLNNKQILLHEWNTKKKEKDEK